jgi:hypothetical protein
VFALGALGPRLLLRELAGGGPADAGGADRGGAAEGAAAAEVKSEARERAPETVRKVAGVLAPKLDEIIDGFAGRLKEFIAEAGEALARGIAEVLDRALAERQQIRDAAQASSEGMAIDKALLELKAIDEQIAEIRQAVWEE